jgi:hypothetical protein
MAQSEPLEKFLSFVEKLMVGAVAVLVIAGCSNSSDNPTINNDGQIYPSITSDEGSLTQQCRAEEIRRNEESVVYLSTYFVVDSSGTEIVQSESEGPTPCP